MDRRQLPQFSGDMFSHDVASATPNLPGALDSPGQSPPRADSASHQSLDVAPRCCHVGRHAERTVPRSIDDLEEEVVIDREKLGRQNQARVLRGKTLQYSREVLHTGDHLQAIAPKNSCQKIIADQDQSASKAFTMPVSLGPRTSRYNSLNYRAGRLLVGLGFGEEAGVFDVGQDLALTLGSVSPCSFLMAP